MKWFYRAVVGLSIVLVGCNGAGNKPIWEDVKIGDLAAHEGGKRAAVDVSKTINFEVCVFEMPAEKSSVLDGVWQFLYTRPLQLNDPKGFEANSFSAGFGQSVMWNKIADILRTAGAEEVKTVSLLVFDGRSGEIDAARLYDEQTIFYASEQGQAEGVTIGPGKIVLRLKVEKIPGLRGVCAVSALPVFLSPIKSKVYRLAGDESSGELAFNSAGFGLKMAPNDFFFLGPKEYVGKGETLGSLFFSGGGHKDVIRTYLIICSRIND